MVMKKTTKLEMMKRMIFLFYLFIIPTIMMGQEFRVSGSVTDSRTGEVFPGVNIIERGTTTGTITNVEGNYSLVVSSPDAVLVFSFVGFVQQAIPINNRAVINISLTEELTALDEIVVIGYATATRASISGSVASVR
jgi:TonB-dependent starch-binding outer membrane protein SusC